MEKPTSTAHRIKNRTTPNDVFYTPLPLVKVHLDLIAEYVKPDDRWFDPFFGQGAYYNNYPTENKDFTEIALDKDFFTYDKEVDVICSNPPFSCMQRVLEHSITLKPRVISYIMGSMNLTPKRIEIMNNNGYGLVKLHMCNVFNWFSMTLLTVFVLGEKNCVLYDRTTYGRNPPRNKKNEKVEK
jgi:hypothetical protein